LGARPELEHAMLVIRCNWLLGFHGLQLRDILDLKVARSRDFSQQMLANVGMSRLQ
jgi:hypothetical protein